MPKHRSNSLSRAFADSYLMRVPLLFANPEIRTGHIAALDHDGRVALIRREIYYKYLWLVPMIQVWNAEYSRINRDPNYEGPKPNWDSSD